MASRAPFAIGLLITSCVVALMAQSPSPADLQQRAQAAIRKSLPLLQLSGRVWNERRPCASCHHHALGSMAVELARDHGFSVDEKLLAEQVDRMRFRTREGALLNDAGINVQVSLSYLLIGTAVAHVAGDRVTDGRIHVIAGKQQPDGHWFSESHRPPLEDSEFTATAVAVRALQLYAPPARHREMASRVERARAWLIHARPRTTEERVMQLFGLAWSSAPQSAIGKSAAALAAEQRPDGGWAQIPSLNSDAYATGASLVALSQAGGVDVHDGMYLRGLRFLLDGQSDDGSWLVRTRRKFPGLPYFESGFPHGVNQFISYAATAWATMALALFEDGARSPIWMSTEPLPRSPAPWTIDDGVTPLMEAAAFGTIDDVKRLIDAGADVNAKSKRGVTALIASVRDPQIASLLLARGAAVDTTTVDGFTPLMFAAGYDGALGLVRELLHRGVPDRTANDGTTALLLAARGGDPHKVDALLGYHAKVDAPHRSGLTAMFVAADQGDAAMVRRLARAGANPNITIPQVMGWTSLSAAAADGFPDVVRALLDAHADVDVKDDEGRTPLDLARLMDTGPGTQSVVDLLTKAGGDRNAARPRNR